jgi:hypothetical protein
MSNRKPVPDEPNSMPAMDGHRADDANLAPQGRVDLDDEAPESIFTPEGDAESVPNIPSLEDGPV